MGLRDFNYERDELIMLKSSVKRIAAINLKDKIQFLIFVLLIFGVTNVQSATYFKSLALGSEPKYGENFLNFDYVDQNAKKGGELRLAAMGSFDKLNPFTLKGLPASGLMQLVFEPLAVSSLDEPMSVYGLIAEKMSLAKDKLSITFIINPSAKFSNGEPILASDVKFSFDTLTSSDASPIWKNYWSDVKQAVVLSKRKIKFNFKRKNRELHMIVASLPVFSQKWGGGKSFSDTVQDIPIASGPYEISKSDLGKSIWFKKRADYWGENHPTRKNQFNFNKISFRYYKDSFARLQAFKAGEFDFIHENVSKNWARSYEGEEFKKGSLIKKEITNSNPAGMQGYVFNIRKNKFKDLRVRKAISLAMDFEWMNRQLFYDQYMRSNSFFTNTEMAAFGKASPKEVELLVSTAMDNNILLNNAIFEVVPIPPTTNHPHSLRKNLKQAMQLLNEAGWFVKNGKLKDDQGNSFKFEVLLDSRGWERVVSPFKRNLQKLGIELNTRVTDISLYKKRIDNFEYDMIVHWYLSGQNPGNELVYRFMSSTVDEKGSDNFIGLNDRLVDAAINIVVSSETREELKLASKVLDRILLFGHYVIPHWHNRVHRVAYREGLSAPKTLPLYYHSEDWAMSSWWWNKRKGK